MDRQHTTDSRQMVDIKEVLEHLQKLENEIYGCGNGKVKVNKYIKELKRIYGIFD